jgi:dihydroxyacetone kinase-like protein
MEFGIGIHGEPGRVRLPVTTADDITEQMAVSIIEDPQYTRTVREWRDGTWQEIELASEPMKKGDSVLAFVNGMGGTPLIELYVVYRQLAEVCQRKGLHIVRSLVGSYITSLEMQGCSITLLRMDPELTELWDAPVNTAALRWGC